MEAEQIESRRHSPKEDVTEYPREETEKAVVQFIGKYRKRTKYKSA